MKGLIVYFSRTGRTRKVAEAIQALTGFDMEEIKEAKGRGGPIGWLKSGMESTRKMLPRIGALLPDQPSYDLVVIGTPIWAANMSSPVRAYITKHGSDIKKAALFCTGDGDKPEKAFVPITELLGKEPIATMGLIGEERESETATQRIEAFVAALSA
ncbi:flavodoxin [Candidatus Bathyarchaeota archaeon]|nr:flavodoxin [Candidatus Bathyarchaeota archaeon]